MNLVAIKMLIGDRAKYLGIVMGLSFASLLVTQQAAIFIGLMTRTYSFIDDTSQGDVWVMDREVEFTEDQKRMLDTELYRVRGIQGVAWAVPVFRSLLNVRLDQGKQVACTVMGIDDASLAGGPPGMVEGTLENLREADGVIVDVEQANHKLAHRPAYPGGPAIPLKIGAIMEINDHHARVVGFCRINRAFFWEPAIYTLFSRAKTYSPSQRRMLSYILVKAKPGENIPALRDRISTAGNLAAYTNDEFRELTSNYVIKSTGIAVNFGIAVALGFIVGAAIAGQTFYNFTLENTRYFAALKAMGASDGQLLRMILVQAVAVGALGYGLGVGAASIFGRFVQKTELAFRMPWQLLVVSAIVVLVICAIAALLGIRRVLKLEPAVVFKG